MSQFNFLFAVSGSIAGYKACALISRLKQEGHRVQVVATQSALKFVGEATLEGLSGERVLTDTFAAGDMMAHIHVAREVDAVILAPASANTMARLAHGFADDLLTTLFLALESHKPKFIAPAMNVEMWNNPATQSSVTRLRELGMHILGPGNGNLACGEIGAGRMLEPDDLYNEIFKILRPKNAKKILVTSGGTREPIDGVRFITNMSTGHTGLRLAESWARSGNQVTLLHAQTAPRSQRSDIRSIAFDTYSDLEKNLRGILDAEHFDYVVHAAAVSDYSVVGATSDSREIDLSQKINSAGDVQLSLKRNPKLISQLKNWSKNPNIKVIGFKLTNTEVAESKMKSVQALLDLGIDCVVHNDLRDISTERSAHRFYIYNNNGVPGKEVQGAETLATELRSYFL